MINFKQLLKENEHRFKSFEEMPLWNDDTGKREVSDKLHERNSFDDHDTHILHKYTGVEPHSEDINTHLIRFSETKKLPKNLEEIHETIKKHIKPLGHSVHLFSGIATSLAEKLPKNPGDILHSPAHISMSHSPRTARTYMKYDDDFNAHMIHIHTKPSDKGLHISRISEFPNEHETILPAGTNLKYHGTSTIPVKNFYSSPNANIKIHHFSIHSQE